MRLCLFVFFITFFCLDRSIAQTTGYGCLVGSGPQRVYTQSLGYGYGGPFNPQYMFKSTGPSVIVNTNGNNGSAENYICGQINYYYYYPLGFRTEYTPVSYNCVTMTSATGTVVQNGTYVYYSYNNPSKCGATPVPLDRYALLLASILGTWCMHLIKRSFLTALGPKMV